MYFEQFYLSCLAHASYMLGSDGVAAVVDPQRDVELYLEEAQRTDLKIKYIIETHLHADFVSGHQELAARTGAQIYIGRAAHAKFPHYAVREGDQIRFGQCVLRFLETPGHTLESICVLVTDLERSAQPFAVLTGDTLFMGDVGRPDLSPEHTPQQLASMLYDSLRSKLLTLPDAVQVYPAHGAGSLCGRNISAERSSTVGDQRTRNYALQPMNREQFVQMLTSDLPVRPGYFALDAEINRAGAAALTDLAAPAPLTPADVERLLGEPGSSVIALDTRPTVQFGAAHVPGAVHIALGGQYAAWAATIIGLERPIILIAEGEQELVEARTRLARVGIENVVGHLDGGVQAWERSGRKLAEVPQIAVFDFATRLREQPGSVQVVDVRRATEWKCGHIEGACHKPLDELSLTPVASAAERLSAGLAHLDRNVPAAVHCKSGYRSSIATSVLRRAGLQNVMNVVGGFDAWQAQNLPVVG